MIGIKGPTEQDLAAEETGDARSRVEATKKFSLGGGLSVGAMVCFGFFEILRSSPQQAFPLLQSWGPRVLLAIIVIYVLYDLAKMAINVAVRLVHALEKLAVAQQKSADKDDRQLMEMQTLTAMTAQRSERASETQQRYHEENQEAIRRLGEKQAEESQKTRHELRNSIQDLIDGRYVRFSATVTTGEKATP